MVACARAILRILAVTVTSLFPAAQVWSADLLDPAEASTLCRKDTLGREVLTADAVAERLITVAGVPLSLVFRAAPAGTRLDDLSSAAKSVLINAYNAPFGAGLTPAQETEVEKLQAALEPLLQLLGTGHTSDRRFIVEPAVENPSGDEFDEFARGVAGFAIVCRPAGVGDTTPSFGAEPLPPKVQEIVDRVKFRGEIGDLRKTLLESSFAKIGYKKDDESDTSFFDVAGVAGFDIFSAGVRDQFRFIPFFRWEKSNISDNGRQEKADINVITPGILVTAFQIPGRRFAAETWFDLRVPIDLEQNAEQVVFSAHLDPTFAITPGRPLLGGWINELGPLLLRPDLSLNASAFHVLRSGDSDALVSAEDFLGVGGELSLKARLAGVPILSNLEGRLFARRLDFVAGDIDENSLFRVGASLAYVFPQFPNASIQFSYANGENFETFQQEDFYRVEIGLRL